MQDQKKDVVERLQSLRNLSKQMRDEARQLKEAIQGSYFKVEDIDKEVARLEARIAHESLELQEEKRIMEQIKALKKSRDLVKEHQAKVGPAMT